MKDYYYILGVNREASQDEIKRAYRKLSHKFHPDKNNGDDFFADRFKEVKEAYDLLYSVEKRRAYDIKNKSGETSNKNFIPVIDYFKVDKIEIEYNDELTFTWKCYNTDYCILKPFGRVNPIDTKKIKIKEYEKNKLSFELIAVNTYIDRQISSKLRVSNLTYSKLKEKIIKEYLQDVETQRIQEEDLKNSISKTKQNVNYDYGTGGTIILLTLCLILFTLFILSSTR